MAGTSRSGGTTEHKDERYDYLYKPAEIQELGGEPEGVKKIVRKSYSYMNNHADAKAVANAIELKHFLGEHVPDGLNPEMLERLPELKASSRSRRSRICWHRRGRGDGWLGDFEGGA